MDDPHFLVGREPGGLRAVAVASRPWTGAPRDPTSNDETNLAKMSGSRVCTLRASVESTFKSAPSDGLLSAEPDDLGQTSDYQWVVAGKDHHPDAGSREPRHRRRRRGLGRVGEGAKPLERPWAVGLPA
jgi:hypothetical protein